MGEIGDAQVYEGESSNLVYANMFELYSNGVIGTKEFRSWLAKVDANFASVRDADVDNEIDEQARERARRRHELEQQGQNELAASNN
jgi:hypothetical protein